MTLVEIYPPSSGIDDYLYFQFPFLLYHASAREPVCGLIKCLVYHHI